MAADVRELHGAWNFRDVADSVADGGVSLRPGRFFRSSELSRLDDTGRELLRELGITDVADLRSPREVERRGPGQVPEQVAIHLLPFPDLAATDGESPHEHAFNRMMTEKADDESISDAATRYMTEEYRRFPKLKGAQRAVRHVISLLAQGRPTIAHCFAGKDRTGFTVATVLEAVGVGRDAIVTDYLRSNAAAPELRSRIMDMIRNRDGATLPPEALTFAEARLSDEVLGVQAVYLDAARQMIDETYGSLGAYLHDAGVTEAELDALRTALLT